MMMDIRHHMRPIISPSLAVLKKSFALPKCLVVAIAGACQPVIAQDLELYMDTKTKQVFAEPGPGRVRLGTFRPVEEQPAPAPTRDSGGAAPAVPEQQLEQRIEQSEQRIDAIEKRDADSSRSPFNDRFQIRGYLQTRYTQMLGGDEGIDLWSDRSVGDRNSLGGADKNYLIRRARLVFQGDVGERLSFYIQPDFASSASNTGNVAQMRDAYGDVYLTTNRVHRLRIGQSKVPFGWENLQSSSNRLAFDRADALNSAVRDERDLGVFYYYTPARVQSLFREINSEGLKHSGNYGMFGLGLYNGQGANRGDRNDNHHVVARLSYPWKLAGGQFFEAGIQAYSGKYVPATGAYRALNDASLTPIVADEYRFGFSDERIGVSVIWYPQPFGLQAEWNWGTTPGLDLAANRILEQDLEGGYVQAMFKIDHAFGTFLPFVKWQSFDGFSKAQTNAPESHVDDVEIGLEWLIAPELELAAVYHLMRRNNLVTGNRAGRVDYEAFDAEALRLQVQFNF